jgi:hypothetical protein
LNVYTDGTYINHSDVRVNSKRQILKVRKYLYSVTHVVQGKQARLQSDNTDIVCRTKKRTLRNV